MHKFSPDYIGLIILKFVLISNISTDPAPPRYQNCNSANELLQKGGSTWSVI